MRDEIPGDAPLLFVAVLDAEKASAGSQWRVRWQIANRTLRPVQVSEMWLPHSLFHGDKQVLRPTLVLASGESRVITLPVRCSPRSGETIENAFLILRVNYGEECRVFVQVRVECESHDSIKPVVEKVTMHPVGFEEDARRGRQEGQ